MVAIRRTFITDELLLKELMSVFSAEEKRVLNNTLSLEERKATAQKNDDLCFLFFCSVYVNKKKRIEKGQKAIASAFPARLNRYKLENRPVLFDNLVIPCRSHPEKAEVFLNLPHVAAEEAMFGAVEGTQGNKILKAAYEAINAKHKENLKTFKKYINKKVVLGWARAITRYGNNDTVGLEKSSDIRDFAIKVITEVTPPTLYFITDPKEIVDWVEKTGDSSTCMHRKSKYSNEWRDHYNATGIHPCSFYIHNPYMAAVGIKTHNGFKARAAIRRTSPNGPWKYFSAIYAGTMEHKKLLKDLLVEKGLKAEEKSVRKFGNWKIKGIWSEHVKDYIFPIPWVDCASDGVDQVQTFLAFDVKTKEFIVCNDDALGTLPETSRRVRLHFRGWKGYYQAKEILSYISCFACGLTKTSGKSQKTWIATTDGKHFCCPSHANGCGYAVVVDKSNAYSIIPRNENLVPDRFMTGSEYNELYSGLPLFYSNHHAAEHLKALPVWEGSPEIRSWTRAPYLEKIMIKGRLHLMTDEICDIIRVRYRQDNSSELLSYNPEHDMYSIGTYDIRNLEQISKKKDDDDLSTMIDW